MPSPDHAMQRCAAPLSALPLLADYETRLNLCACRLLALAQPVLQEHLLGRLGLGDWQALSEACSACQQLVREAADATLARIVQVHTTPTALCGRAPADPQARRRACLECVQPKARRAATSLRWQQLSPPCALAAPLSARRWA